MQRAAFGLIVSLFGLIGCDAQPKATLVGGKPVSHWLTSLHDKDARTRKAAATHLGNVCATEPAAMTALIEALKDPTPEVRCEVLLALMHNGSAAKEAIPKITELQQKDPNDQVRAYAAKALEKIR
jgi:HEAT repeat protein